MKIFENGQKSFRKTPLTNKINIKKITIILHYNYSFQFEDYIIQ